MHLPGFKPETEPPQLAEPEVEVRIRGLMMDPSTKMPIVVLNDLAGEVVLPIWVVVGSLREDTFHATIWMDQAGEVVALDARPSDAIALALRSDCPIFVSQQVFEHARRASNGNASLSPEDLRRWLEGLNDDEMGRYKM
jgi:bifunctional DNase/RNase